MTSPPQLWTNMLLWSPRRSPYDQIHLGILMTLAWKNLLDDVSKDAGVVLSSQNIAWHGVAQCKLMKSFVLNPKTKYYSNLISESSSNRKALFQTIDQLLHRKPETRLRYSPSPLHLANQFGDFFHLNYPI